MTQLNADVKRNCFLLYFSKFTHGWTMNGNSPEAGKMRLGERKCVEVKGTAVV